MVEARRVVRARGCASNAKSCCGVLKTWSIQTTSSRGARGWVEETTRALRLVVRVPHVPRAAERQTDEANERSYRRPART
jgi:hypothetical protein